MNNRAGGRFKRHGREATRQIPRHQRKALQTEIAAVVKAGTGGSNDDIRAAISALNFARKQLSIAEA